jgi:hypothetical protein
MAEPMQLSAVLPPLPIHDGLVMGLAWILSGAAERRRIAPRSCDETVMTAKPPLRTL